MKRDRDNISQAQATDRSPSHVLLLILLFLLADLAPLLIMAAVGVVISVSAPSIFELFSDREILDVVIALGGFVATFIVLFNHGFWIGFFRELANPRRPAAPNHRFD